MSSAISLTYRLQIYIALLKFDFFFFLGFTVQFIVVVRHTPKSETALTIAAIPITIVLLLMAAYIIRRESYIGQAGIIIVYFAAMAYFIFKLVSLPAHGRVGDVGTNDSGRHACSKTIHANSSTCPQGNRFAHSLC